MFMNPLCAVYVARGGGGGAVSGGMSVAMLSFDGFGVSSPSQAHRKNTPRHVKQAEASRLAP